LLRPSRRARKPSNPRVSAFSGLAQRREGPQRLGGTQDSLPELVRVMLTLSHYSLVTLVRSVQSHVGTF